MKKIVIIPARYQSTRFPGKMLHLYNGKAIVHHVYDNVIKCRIIDQCIIATDDERILTYCKTHHLNAIMTSSDHTNGTERIAEVAAKFNEEDIIINVQGDEPLISTIEIETLIGLMTASDRPSISTLARLIVDKKVINNPHTVKLVKDVKGFALYFSRLPVPYIREEDSVNIPFFQHVGVYGFTAGMLRTIVKLSTSTLELAEKLEQLRWLENGFKIKVGLTDRKMIGIDTPEDMERLLNEI